MIMNSETYLTPIKPRHLQNFSGKNPKSKSTSNQRVLPIKTLTASPMGANHQKTLEFRQRV